MSLSHEDQGGDPAWRQLNLHYIHKRSLHFELLADITNISFDPLPASCLQQFDAWKEQVVRYQELSGEKLPDSIKLSAVVNGLNSSVRNFVLLHLDSDCSFEDLGNLLAIFFSMHDRQVFSLTIPWDKACTDKQDTGKGKGHESNPSFKQPLGEGGNQQDQKRKGEANPPSLLPMKARESLISFQNENNGAVNAGRKGTEPKLAGGTATSSINSSTYNNNNNNNKLGTIQASSSKRLQKLPKRDLNESMRQPNR